MSKETVKTSTQDQAEKNQPTELSDAGLAQVTGGRSDLLVSSDQTGGSTATDVPTETYSLNFEEIRF